MPGFFSPIRYNVGFIFNEESGYSEENTSDNEDFRSTIFRSFQFVPEQKKMCGNDSHEEETKHIYPSVADLLHTRIGNLIGANAGIAKTKPQK